MSWNRVLAVLAAILAAVVIILAFGWVAGSVDPIVLLGFGLLFVAINQIGPSN